MKIAVIFDSISSEGGGNFYQSLQSALILNDLGEKNKDYKFEFIALNKISYTKLKEKNLKTNIFNNIKKSKIYYYFYQSEIFKILFRILKIKNPFKNYLEKNKFDIVIFLNASWFIKLCDGFNFIMSSFDINHKLLNFFPEYLNDNIFKSKDEIMKKSCNQAFKILVDTEESKNELINFYNCSERKISIQPFSPYLPNFKDLNQNTLVKDKKLLNLINQKFLLYPAQFWSHKNHKYLVEALSILKEKHNIKIKIIFCGKDKGNLEFVKKLVTEKNLDDEVYFVDFVSEEEMVLLYKKCLALVMPTYVARSTLPLYEAFYFKVPVFYSKGILDKSLEKFVVTFDLNDFASLATKLKEFVNNEINLSENINNANKYFLENCNKEKLSENYTKILNEYKFLKSIWKN